MPDGRLSHLMAVDKRVRFVGLITLKMFDVVCM